MSYHLARCFAVAVLGSLSLAAMADSFTSSASSAGSKSSGSVSDSIGASSNSSSPDKKTAAGVYRVEQVAELKHKPDHLRLHLKPAQAGAAGDALWLDLPRETVQSQQLAVRSVIELRERPYGLEVALAAVTRTAAAPVAAPATPAVAAPFFLLLADEWRQALETRPVTL